MGRLVGICTRRGGILDSSSLGGGDGTGRICGMGRETERRWNGACEC